MRRFRYALFALGISATAFAAPFAPKAPDEAFGAGSAAWRFSSNLSKEASGVLEICYIEDGKPERVLGRVDVRPFRSSEAKSPDLRIVFAAADIDGAKKIILLIGYGPRSGVFVADIPALTRHSLSVSGTPRADSSGEFTLLGFGDAVKVTPTGMEGLRGRLFFRYVERA